MFNFNSLGLSGYIVEIHPVHDIGIYYGSMIDNVLIDVELLQVASNVKVVLL